MNTPATPPELGATVTPPETASTAPAAAPPELAELLDEPAQRSWWCRWTAWAAVAGVLALAAGAYAWRRHSLGAAAPIYSTAAVVRGDLTLVVTANGTIQPTRTINIGSELSGTVLKVNVDVNDVIRKGQVLVQLDTAKQLDQIKRSQAAVASATAKLAATEATVAQSSATLGRFEAVAELSGGKVPAKTELDIARATLARAVADNGVSAAAVQDARAALSTDQINLSKASITAPADGVVLTRTVDPGNAVAAALQAVTLFTVAEDLKKLRVWVYVDEADVGAVKLGQDATFTVSAYASRNFPARITRVGQGSTITDNVVTYLTYLDVDNADLSLRPGMTATASITATKRTGVLLVPNTALRYAPSTAVAAKKGMASGMSLGPPKTEMRRKGAADSASTAAARQVWVLQGQGADAVPTAVAVTPGISDGHMTEITGGDLKVGMLVITDQKSAVK
ncbi:efflux RND transporter periplasmic adaptor subunit [Roseateles sp.]|uniref:efflux RND transporter periplasmic adaptor subunit n=1 Tax=Roseateles sp. TaxID=1971397 RepID=UPI0032637E2E